MADADRKPRHYVVAMDEETAKEACRNLGIRPSDSTTVLITGDPGDSLNIFGQDTVIWVRGWSANGFAAEIGRAVGKAVLKLPHSPEQREVSS